MIRRNIIFKEGITGRLYITPEFNGDKEEFAMRGFCVDGCSKDWDEILQEFEGVKTLSEFKTASKIAQSYYYSFLGIETLPVEKIENIDDIINDYVYLIDNGDVKQITI